MGTTETIVASAITEAVVAAANDPAIPGLKPTDAQPVSASIVKDLVPVIINQTNNEPWYQSRVTWGVIIAAASTLAKPFLGDLGVDTVQAAEYADALATLGQLVGFGLTLYGRWVARKAIGA